MTIQHKTLSSSPPPDTTQIPRKNLTGGGNLKQASPIPFSPLFSAHRPMKVASIPPQRPSSPHHQWASTSISTFIRLPHQQCLKTRSTRPYDIAILGGPFDRAVSCSPAPASVPRTICSSSARQTPFRVLQPAPYAEPVKYRLHEPRRRAPIQIKPPSARPSAQSAFYARKHVSHTTPPSPLVAPRPPKPTTHKDKKEKRDIIFKHLHRSEREKKNKIDSGFSEARVGGEYSTLLERKALTKPDAHERSDSDAWAPTGTVSHDPYTSSLSPKPDCRYLQG